MLVREGGGRGGPRAVAWWLSSDEVTMNIWHNGDMDIRGRTFGQPSQAGGMQRMSARIVSPAVAAVATLLRRSQKGAPAALPTAELAA